MKGRVVVMTGIKEVKIREYDVPKAERGAVVVETIKSNVCGSEIHMWEGRHPLKNHVLGHEMVGRIIDLGEGVETDYAGQKLSIGDRVVPVYYLTCQKCPACLSGHFNLCVHGSDFMGQIAEKYPHFTGGFSTHYYIQPNQYFYKVPDSLSDNIAAGANCGIAQMVYAIDVSGLRVNDNLVILGAGGLGLFASAVGNTMGATVMVVESVDARLQEARKFGADHVIDMKRFDTTSARLAEIDRITDGQGAHVVLEVAGVPKAFDEGIRLVRFGGTYVGVGNVSVDENQNTTVVPGILTRKCVTVKGILRYQPWYLHKTLKFLEKHHHRYPFDSLTDRTYSLEEVPLAMERATAREVARAIIEPHK
jgi:D-arabinose 1-dehydrogenase-like Zn-dependent alcohol dehydrogenase